MKPDDERWVMKKNLCVTLRGLIFNTHDQGKGLNLPIRIICALTTFSSGIPAGGGLGG